MIVMLCALLELCGIVHTGVHLHLNQYRTHRAMYIRTMSYMCVHI